MEEFYGKSFWMMFGCWYGQEAKGEGQRVRSKEQVPSNQNQVTSIQQKPPPSQLM
jgi:hypothetical protein